MITATDLFCGAGGSSIGLEAAGMELKLAANHWERAIATHAANFPHAEHLCADINRVDMRRLPHTDVLWASVICTEASPAGGKRRKRGQQDLLEDHGHVSSAGFERTRACALDVIRATEVHAYKAIVVENVTEFATDWELFDWWIEGMCKLHNSAYRCQIISVSSAHVYGPKNMPAPQWRDRIYIVFTLKKMRTPNLDVRPAAWCPECDVLVDARQAWKREGQLIGKYGRQYNYRCPSGRCGHTIVEPFVLPAISAIDCSDLGQRIGDRDRPLAASTLRRVWVGREMFAQPVTVAVGGGTFEREGYTRVWPADDAPMRTRTATAGDAVASPPLVLNVNHQGDDGRPFPADSAPLAPRTTKVGEAVVHPSFYVKSYGSAAEAHHRAHPITDPLGTVTTTMSHGLVSTPFITMLRNHTLPTSIDDPLATIAGAGRHHALTLPPGAFIQKHHGGLNYDRIEHMLKSVDVPLPSVVGKPNLSLVIPYRRGKAKTTAEPLHTLATKDSAALASMDWSDLDDCHFRMLKPREHLRAQRFHDSYIVEGNKGEQTMQAGNAVSVNAAQFIAERLMEVL